MRAIRSALVALPIAVLLGSLASAQSAQAETQVEALRHMVEEQQRAARFFAEHDRRQRERRTRRLLLTSAVSSASLACLIVLQRRQRKLRAENAEADG
jgi:thymidylate kinase